VLYNYGISHRIVNMIYLATLTFDRWTKTQDIQGK